EKRVRIGVARVSEGCCESGVRRGEVERTGPVPAGGFTIPQPLVIDAELKIVTAVSDRQIVGERGPDIVIAGLAPAIEPVDVRGRASHTAPICSSWNRAEVIVLRGELRRGVVQCGLGQSVDHAVGRYD